MKQFFKVALVLLLLAGCGGEAAKDAAVTVPSYTIQQFYKTKNVRGGALSPDETRLLFSSNETGIYNLYEIDIASGKQSALTTNTEESFFAIDYTPAGEVLYSADKGGNELSHIYLRKPDGSIQDLTPGEKEKAEFAGWATGRKSFFYISNKRDERFFDLYRMDLDGWKSSVIYKNTEGYDVGEIAPDGSALTLTRSITTSENDLFLCTLPAGAIKRVSAENSGSHWQPGPFVRDGKSFYYISDNEGEFASLYQFDIAKDASRKVQDAKWDVSFASLSETDKYFVVVSNEDGRNAISVTEHATGAKVAIPAVPGGDVIAVAIGPGEKWMRLTVGSSRAPADLYVFNFETKELKQLTHNLNEEMKTEHLVEAQVVRYKSFDGVEIPAIYYKPHQADASHKVPAVVWVHGGPGGQTRVGYSPFIQFMVNHGYAVLGVNNRGSSGYGKSFFKMDDRNHGDKDLKDCIWGKKYLQSLDYIDGEKIGIIGGSYGGYMTMAAMTFTPDEFKVGVDIFGVTNWLRTLKSVPPYWESFRKALYAEMGDPTTADSVRLYNISPLFHAAKVKNPVMVLQGANDPRVLQVESDEIVAAIKKNNVPVEYIVFPDEGHGFLKKENEMKGYQAVVEFLDKHLKGGGK